MNIISGILGFVYFKKTSPYKKRELPKLEIMYIDPINNISTEDKNAGKDYISIMNDNIDKLKQELY